MNTWISGQIILPTLEAMLRRRTFKYFKEMMQSQWLSETQLEEIQLAKLRELIGVALNNTTRYAELAGVDKSWRPESLEDLKKLPLLDKQTISKYREQLVNRSVAGGPKLYNTGGSSGTPLIFYFDKRRQACDKAARMRTHSWWAVEPGQKEAYIWGSPVELSKQDHAKKFRDWITNELLLSAFDLSEKNIGWYVEKLTRFGPASIFGYPSSIALLCKLARKAGLDLSNIGVKVVFSTAEVLYEHQKETISESFGRVPVVNGYGSREGGFISHECPEGAMHITSENLIVEFIKDGVPVKAGENGEIVITHLDNHAMPFIRYRTGDIGQAGNAKCPCGRGLEVMEVLRGRTTDFIIAPDGRWVHGLALIYIVRAIPGVGEYQIVQNDVDSISVRIVPDDSFPHGGERLIEKGFAQRLGAQVKVTVEQSDRIIPDKSGKYRYIISQVAKEKEALL